MIKTKIKKAIAIIALVGLTSANVGATQIGTGSVVGTSSFDSVINWNDTYTTAAASGSVNGIVITAKVEPVLNMSISTGAIDLGTLTPGVASNGTLNIEVGTNAANGVNITARSNSGGLTNTTDNSIQINNLTTDGSAESYTWGTAHTADTNKVTGFTQTNPLATTQINNTTTEHTIYTTNKAEPSENVDDIAFTVTAQSKFVTPAGSYKDTVTFTVTGNF